MDKADNALQITSRLKNKDTLDLSDISLDLGYFDIFSETTPDGSIEPDPNILQVFIVLLSLELSL